MKIYEGNERTLPGIIEDKAKTWKDRVFLFYGDEQVTYNQLNDNGNRISNALIDLGVRKGENIGLMIPNCVEYFYIWFGITKAGAIDVPIHINLRGRTLSDLINRSDCETIFVDQALLDRLRVVQEELRNVKKVVVCPCRRAEPLSNSELGLRFATVHYTSLLAYSCEPPGVDVEPSDLASIAFTSGTTGPPKGIMMSHNYHVHFAETKAKYMRTTSEDVFYNTFPMTNHAGNYELAWCAFQADARLVLVDRFDHERFWDDIRRHQCTEWLYLGGLLSRLLAQPKSENDKDHPVRAWYGIAATETVQRAFEERFGVRLIEIYGMNEGNIPAYTPFDARKPGSCGKAIPDFELKIFDDNDHELSPGQVGEIVWRPKKPFTVMNGYYKMPERTIEMWRNLWFHSGDLGYLDEDGYLFFVRRKAESIRSRAYFISPTQVEEIVNSHSKVLASCAIGIPGEIDQDVMVWIEPVADEHITAEELMAYCEENMPYYMVPRYIQFTDALPLTTSEKVARHELKKIGVTDRTWDRKKARYRLGR